MFVLNVIGKGADPALFCGPNFGPPAILSPDFAFDLPVDDIAVLQRARARAPGLDINLVRVEGRRKKLLAADMDSTIITVECLDEIAALAGIDFHAVTEQAMRGELDFVGALRARVAMLKGVSLSLLESVLRENVRLTPGARALVATMRAHGAHTMLVTGGFTIFADAVAREAGFDDVHCNRLLDDGARLTGEIAAPIQDADGKAAAMAQAAARLGIGPADCLAVGDGANDIAMLSRAGLGVGFHAKPIAAAAANAIIAHNDLTALLYLQGYNDAEISRA